VYFRRNRAYFLTLEGNKRKPLNPILKYKNHFFINSKGLSASLLALLLVLLLTILTQKSVVASINTEVDLGIVSLQSDDQVEEGDILEIFGYVRNYAADPYNGSIPINIRIEDYLPQNIAAIEEGQFSLSLDNVSIGSDDSIAFSIDIPVDDSNFSINTTDIIIIWPSVNDDVDLSNDYAFKSVFVSSGDDESDDTEGGSSDDEGGSSDDEGDSSDDEGGSSDDDNSETSDSDEDENNNDNENPFIGENDEEESDQGLILKDGECYFSAEIFQSRFAMLDDEKLECISVLIFDAQSRLHKYARGSTLLSLDLDGLDNGLYKVLVIDEHATGKEARTVVHFINL